jgi:hypothetical protein
MGGCVTILAFLHGGLTLGCFVIGLVFLKFWRVSRDRFFIWFCSAFWIFAIGWALRAFVTSVGEHSYLVYLPRLVAFLLIIAGIVDKNRQPPSTEARD